MNMIISAFVGALVATSAAVAGTNMVQDEQEPVAQTELYTYSSR